MLGGVGRMWPADRRKPAKLSADGTATSPSFTCTATSLACAPNVQRGPQQQQPHNVQAHSAHQTATQVCKGGPNALFVSAAVVVLFVSAAVVALFVSAAVVVEHDHAVVPALTAVHHCGALSLRFEVQEEVVTEQFHVVDGLF